MADALPVYAWVLRGQRRVIVLWSVALAAVGAVYIGFWPAMGSGDEMQALIEGMPEGLVQALGYDAIGTPAGYLESTVYGLLAPVLMLVFGISLGARLIAGLEESGALELELTAPATRTRVLLERFAALATQVVVLAAVIGAVTLLLVAALDMEVGAGPILGATLGLLLLVLAIATITLTVGAATGRRAVALAVGAAVAVLGFIANALAPLLDDGRWLEVISPFWWYLGSDPLNTGGHAGWYGALVALTVVALVIGLQAFERRDLGT